MAEEKVELSKMGLRIQRFYTSEPPLWTKKQVHDVTGVKAITEEEYFIITGEVYVVPFVE